MDIVMNKHTNPYTMCSDETPFDQIATARLDVANGLCPHRDTPWGSCSVSGDRLCGGECNCMCHEVGASPELGDNELVAETTPESVLSPGAHAAIEAGLARRTLGTAGVSRAIR